MAPKGIGDRLLVLPPAASAAFAVRVAMRWVPFFAEVPKSGMLARFSENDLLWLLREFFCQISAVCGAYNSEVGWRFSRKNWFRPDSYQAGDVHAAADYAHNAAVFAAGYAADDALAAYEATIYTQLAAEHFKEHFTEKEIKLIDQQVECDLQILEGHSAAFLIDTPLWEVLPPKQWQARWTLFQQQVLQIDPSFSFWLQWYQDRLDGKPVDIPLLEKWLDLPKEIEAQSPAAINRYLATLHTAKERLNRVRTIFIGYGDAGKTSLIRTLHGEPVVEGRETMTPGIEIREWEGAGNDIMTHFWDFGGQVMAHSTHQFFLRSSCLYVLVLSARAEINATEQAEYWLQHVKAFGGDAPVMIVGNKDDQIPVQLNMASLQEKYKNVLNFYPLSCTQAQGSYAHKFQAFLHDFREQLTQLGTRQVMFTDAQFKVLKALRQRAAKHAFIAHKEFNDLCQQHQIGQPGDYQEREFLLDLLDKLGVVIHFKGLPFLSEHVLNPRWLTYGVYTVMYAHRPRLSMNDIATLLAKTKVLDEGGQELTYPPEKCLFIATAMQRFKLCYHLRHDSNQFIIPGLLETDQPPGLKQAKFDQSQALAFKIAFTGFVPRHVMPEMIVERNADIEGDIVWQYGVLLKTSDPAAR